MPLVGGLCHVQRTSPIGQHDSPLVGGLCLVQRTSPVGQHDLPLIGGLCLEQRTSPVGQHDLPLIGGLCLVQRTSPVGQHDLPLIGGLCHIQRTSTLWVSMIAWQSRAWHKTNDTSRVAPKNDAKRIPKDRMLRVVEESVRLNDNDLNYLNGLKILGGRFSRWWTKQSDDGKLALDDAQSKKQWAYRKERWSLEKGETHALWICVFRFFRWSSGK
jgi:hypothetical protein